MDPTLQEAMECLSVQIDNSKSLRSIVHEILELAFKRQKEGQATMVAGAVLQNLVGAKLRIALLNEKISCQVFSAADALKIRHGDFLVGDTAIHVTTAPTEALLEKCRENINQALRPLIITTSECVGVAIALARNICIEDRLEVLDIEQFVATNVLSWSSYKSCKRDAALGSLFGAYNQIAEEHATSPSLLIIKK